MIAADANLIAQLVLEHNQTELARAIYQRDPNWVMPELWRHELLNVLANHCRFKKVSYDKLLVAWQHAITLFADSVKPVDMPLALKIAGERNVTAYDAQYLVLAKTLDIPLVTEDRKLRQAAPDLTLSMQAFLSSTTIKYNGLMS